MKRGRLAACGLSLLAFAGCATPREGPAAPALSDAEFWRIVGEFSEPDGSWDSENFLSDERGFQRVIPELEARLPRGGVYVGVGPEQNFTYVAALRPRLAFIVDIRRGNLLLHLFYKALFESSAGRAEFLSKLFGRPQPAGLAEDASIDALLAAFRTSAPDEDFHRGVLRAMKDRLTKHHGFPLTDGDLAGIDVVAEAFFQRGPDLDFNYPKERFGSGRIGGEPFPTYAELMSATDDRGAQRGFLATEANFLAVAGLQLSNAIVPLVGDFAGPKTIRAIGGYLAEHRATVTAFYTSNVELYLFQSDAWKKFYANAASLPVDSNSTFIRFGSKRVFIPPDRIPGPGCSTRLSPIADLVRAVEAGEVTGYYEVLERSR